MSIRVTLVFSLEVTLDCFDDFEGLHGNAPNHYHILFQLKAEWTLGLLSAESIHPLSFLLQQSSLCDTTQQGAL